MELSNNLLSSGGIFRKKNVFQIRLTEKHKKHLANLTYKAVRKKKVHETIQTLCKGLARELNANTVDQIEKYSKGNSNSQS